MDGVHTLGVSSRVSLALSLILGSSSLAAQEVPGYGVDSTSVAVVSAWDLQPVESAITWSASQVNGYRYLTNNGALFGAVHVPQGASLLAIELDACDTSGTEEVVASFARIEGSGFTPLAAIGTGEGPTPGCARFAADLTAGPETVDNAQYLYFVSAQNGSFTGTTAIGAIRVVYKLQVSPAPGVATFNDVPTSDTAFQFVEALVASGITAGCGGGSYCPDAPLTRRQMAVFLAKALGLHWPAGPVN
jgi:hypothetical protein